MKALWKTKSRAELMADKVADNGREPNKYNYWIEKLFFFRPEMLVDEEVVVVTINYRLGALGFLSTDTPR